MSKKTGSPISGKVPNAHAKVFLDGQEREAIVGPSGEIRVHTYTVKEAIEGEEQITYKTFIPKEEGQLLRKMEKKKSAVLEKVSPERREADVVMHGDFSFIRSEKAFRTAAKIAYNGLALKCGTAFAGSDRFAEIRRFICNGGHPNPVRLFLNQNLLNRSRIDPHYHSLTITCDAKRRTAYAIVVIFGALFYLIELTGNYDGIDFFWPYAYDAQTGKPCDSIVAHIENELLMVQDILAGGTVWNDVKQSAACLMHYIGQARPDIRIERESGA